MSADLSTGPAGGTADSESASRERLPKGGALLVGIMVVSAFVVILNETIMSVALPSLMVDLDISASTAQWLTSGFLLTMAVVIPLSGFILQRFTERSVYLAAIGLFSLGTLVAALAPGFAVLLIGRVLQASGTALMMPLVMTTVMNVVPASIRGRIMGSITIVIAVAPAIGPTISGAILSVLDWRYMFWFMLPIALLTMALGGTLIRNVTEPQRVSFDIPSVILSAFAFGGTIFGLSSIGEAAQGHSLVAWWIPLAIGLVALAVFVSRQLRLQRRDGALLDLRVFRTRSFTVGTVVSLSVMMLLLGSLVLLPIYLQQVLEVDTLTTGLMLLPGGLVMGFLSPITGRIFDRVGPRPVIIPGAIIVSLGAWGFATLLNEHTSIATVVVIHMVISVGMSAVMTPVMTSALGSLPSTLYSYGSAIIGTIQQLAGAAGTALFVSLMAIGTGTALASGLDTVTATNAGTHAAFLGAAIFSLVGVTVSFLIQRPTETPALGADEGDPDVDPDRALTH